MADPEADERATKPAPSFDLTTTPVHLGMGSRIVPLDGFSWDPDELAAYGARFAADGIEGRLVGTFRQEGDWSSWEAHPAGEELVALLSGRAELVQELDGGEHRVQLSPGQAVVNPPGVWHTMDVHEPGDVLFITPGEGTEHRPR